MFNTLLHADGPAADRAAAMMLYGRFVGSWDGIGIKHNPDGSRREVSAEVHFGWVLEGRAIQDVWLSPALATRAPGEASLMYGSTTRVYDPGKDLWHITWIDPTKPIECRMTGRAVGEDIVQEYVAEDGLRVQWMFTEITRDSFHWMSREATPEGGWRVLGEYFLRRRG